MYRPARPLQPLVLLLCTACAGQPEPRGDSSPGDVILDTLSANTGPLDTGPGEIVPADSGAEDTAPADAGPAPECGADKPCSQPGTACVQASCEAGRCRTSPAAGACDDGDPCTKNDRCAGGACAGDDAGCQCVTQQDCAAYEDGDPCNGTLLCDLSTAPHRCRVLPGSPVVCDTSGDTVCRARVCDSATGKCAAVAAPDGTACDDGDPCPVESFCKSGVCTSGAATYCQCKTEGDCKSFGDGDPCNGTLYCEKSVFPPRCVINPASVVHCVDGDPTDCKLTACDPETGKCATTTLADGTACEQQGGSCKNDAVCKAGACRAQTDICECTANADCADKEDGDYCNGTLYCDRAAGAAKGSCKPNPATVITCATVQDTACAANKCVPTTGACVLQPAHEGKPCEDGEACTVGDVCKGSECQPGKDTCSCASDADCKDKDDGNKCNGTDFCNLATKQCEPNPKTFVVCKKTTDSNCRRAACEPAAGVCAPTPLEAIDFVSYADGKKYPQVRPPAAGTLTNLPCDDGDACTQGDTCSEGKCTAGADICACAKDADCAAFDDGNLCNGVMVCDKVAGKCLPSPKTVVVCKTVDDTACLKRRCQPQTGKCLLTAEPFGSLCDDGSACTTGDYCNNQGECLGGKKVCACESASDCAQYDDGDDCNGVPYCDRNAEEQSRWKCVANNPATAVFCNPKDDTACLVNACAAGKCGLRPRKDGTSCEDGDACTPASACAKGKCAGTGQLACDDHNACTDDSCDPAKGCIYAEKKGFCDDGNSCTVGACDPKTGNCSHDKKSRQGKPCNADNSGCTVGDTCDLGVCRAGPVPKCNVQLAVCEQARCAPKDANNFSCVVTKAPDGAACPGDGSPCSLGGVCKAGACDAGASRKLCSATVAGPGGTHVYFTAAARLGDAWVAGGARYGRNGGGISSVAWRIVAWAPGCKQLWSIDETLSATARDLVALLPRAGGLWAVGSTGLGYIGMRSVGDGKLGPVVKFPRGSTATEYARAAARFPSGDLAVEGVVGKLDGSGTPTFKRVSGDGVVIANSTAAWFPPWRTGALVIGADGRPVVVGAVGVSGSPNRRAAYRIGAKFVLEKPVAFGSTTAQSAYEAAVADSGGIVVGGYRTASGSKAPIGLVGRLSTGLKLLWEHEVGADTVVRALAPRPGGGWLLGGTRRGQATGEDAWLAVADTSANVHRQQVVYKAGDDTITALLALPDGLIAVGHGGYTKAKTTRERGTVVRADPWAHRTCEQSGKCGAVTAKDCDDGKPCTADGCDPSDGSCTHTPADGFACDGGGCAATSVCAKGACVPKSDERLWLATAPDGTDSSHRERVAGLMDNGARGVVAAAVTGAGPRVWALDPLGRAASVAPALSRYAAFPDRTADGDLLLPAPGGRPTVRRLSPDLGTTRWTAAIDKPAEGGTCEPIAGGGLGRSVGVRAMSDDTVGVLITAVAGTPARYGVAWARLTAKGAGLYKRCYPPPAGRSELPRAAVVATDGSARLVAAVGPGLEDEKQATALLVVGNEGKLLSRRVYAGGRFDAAVDLGGDTMLGGWIASAGGRRPALMRLDAAGELRWRKILPADGGGEVVGLRAAGGGVVLARSEKLGFKRRARLEGYSTAGVRAWSGVIDRDGLLVPRALAPASGGGWWLGGEIGPSGKRSAFVARLDRWGHAGCRASGPCWAASAGGCEDGDACTTAACGPEGCTQLPLACDDGNACTADSCAKGAGCVHKAIAGSCDDGDKCTEKDACKGRLCVGIDTHCDDGQSCTADSCLPASGCRHEARPDGSSCPVTNGCSSSATCKTGSCEPSADGRLWSVSPAKHDKLTIEPPIVAVAIGDGGAAALWQRAAVPGAPYALQVGKVGPKGEYKWVALSIAAVGPSTERLLTPHLFALPGGDYLVATTKFMAPSNIRKSHPALVRTTPEGRMRSRLREFPASTAIAGPHPRFRVLGLTALVDATWATVGMSWSDTRAPSAEMLRVDSSFKLVARWRLERPGATTRGDALLPTDAGGVIAFGTEERPGVPAAALVFALDAKDKTAFVRTHFGSRERRFFSAVRAGPTAYVAAGSTLTAAGLRAPWLASLGLDGALRWSRELPQPAATAATFVGRRADGVLVLAGTRPNGIGKSAWVQWTDPLGHPAGRVDVKYGTSNWLGAQGVAMYPDGGLLLGGTAVLAGTSRPMLVRMDAWGHSSCPGAGPCMALAPAKAAPAGCEDGDPCTIDACDAAKGCVHHKADCDDTNPCTTDACNAVKGCTHTAKAGPCDDGSLCTTGEACSAGVCTAKATKDCSDGNPCTADLCSPASGCLHPPLDGASCDDGTICGPDATCAKGVCTYTAAGRFFAGPYDLSTDSTQQLRYDAAALYGDTIVALSAVAVYRSQSKSMEELRGYVSRLDAFGRGLDQNDHLTSSGAPRTALVAGGSYNQGPLSLRRVLHLDGKRFVALADARWYWRSRYSIHLYMIDADRGLDMAGDREFRPPTGSDGNHTEDYRAGDMAPVVDGSLAICGSRYTRATKRWDAMLIRADGTGLERWKAYSARPGGGDDFADAMFVDKSGHAWLAGRTHATGGPDSALLLRFDNGGAKTPAKLLWRRDHGITGKTTGYRSIAAVQGGLLAAGWYADGPDMSPLLARHDETGKLVWRKYDKLPWPSSAQGMVVSGDGSILLAGDRADGIVRKAWVRRLTSQGAPAWTREYRVGKTTFLGHQAILGMADGGALLLAGTTAFSRRNPALIRIDAWGHVSCGESGACRTTGLLQCAKKCAGKLALCDPKSGCVCK